MAGTGWASAAAEVTVLHTQTAVRPLERGGCCSNTDPSTAGFWFRAGEQQYWPAASNATPRFCSALICCSAAVEKISTCAGKGAHRVGAALGWLQDPANPSWLFPSHLPVIIAHASRNPSLCTHCILQVNDGYVILGTAE